MIMIPLGAGERAFAIDWFMADMAQGRLAAGDAGELLAQLRIIGDVANLERLARALAAGDARRGGRAGRAGAGGA